MTADAIIFDLDGTLWDSLDGIHLTWNRVMARHPEVRGPISKQELENVLGMQMDEITRTLFPNESSERQAALIEECVIEENAYLERHGGILYPHLEETLAALAKQHRLFIVSNCQAGYIEAFLTAHQLWEYFEGKLCFGDTGNGKKENIQAVVRTYGLQNPIYVGDTQGDKNASTAAGVPFVFASYGFGAVDDYTASIDSFDQLACLFS